MSRTPRSAIGARSSRAVASPPRRGVHPIHRSSERSPHVPVSPGARQWWRRRLDERTARRADDRSAGHRPGHGPLGTVSRHHPRQPGRGQGPGRPRAGHRPVRGDVRHPHHRGQAGHRRAHPRRARAPVGGLRLRDRRVDQRALRDRLLPPRPEARTDRDLRPRRTRSGPSSTSPRAPASPPTT